MTSYDRSSLISCKSMFGARAATQHFLINMLIIKSLNIYNLYFKHFYDECSIFFEYTQKTTKQPVFANF